MHTAETPQVHWTEKLGEKNSTPSPSNYQRNEGWEQILTDIYSMQKAKQKPPTAECLSQG